ncbi:hypothetical protein ACFQJC_06275 [Haloferax namakaokahaiae]|uniref:Uncharacterized protein n=1 Tax=Haloferax namakaokahaiae TaxID=1748331 RepID=A0ABD5ZDP6_9EURY
MTQLINKAATLIERGIDAIIAINALSELFEAIDFEAVFHGDVTAESVDVGRLASALSRPVGRFVAYRFVSGSGATGFAKRSIVEWFGQTATSGIIAYVFETISGTDDTTTLDDRSSATDFSP